MGEHTPMVHCMTLQWGVHGVHMPSKLGAPAAFADIHLDPLLRAADKPGAILAQVEYYLSRENLSKDHWLVSHMDSQGFVPLTVVAEFHRIKALDASVEDITTAIKSSEKVSLSEDAARVRPNVKVSPPRPPVQA